MFSLSVPFGENNTSLVGVPSGPAETEDDGEEHATQTIRRNEMVRGKHVRRQPISQ